jgi:hypothetical protein
MVDDRKHMRPRRFGMSVRALFEVRPMKGRSESKLMYCDDDNLYIVKLSSNPRESPTLVGSI